MISMVEWDNGPHREMAVDVPESFIPRNKTPPRYPPQKPPVFQHGIVNNSNDNSTLPSKKKIGMTPQNGKLGKPVPLASDPDEYAPEIPPRPGDMTAPRKGPPPQPPLRNSTPTANENGALTRDQSERLHKYQEDLRLRREEEERRAKEEELLRSSLRGSKKLHALESNASHTGVVNSAFNEDGEEFEYKESVQKPVVITDLVASLQRIQQILNKVGPVIDNKVLEVQNLLYSSQFSQVLAVFNQVQGTWCYNRPPTPVCSDAQDFLRDSIRAVALCNSKAGTELQEVLAKFELHCLFYAHDKIAERDITLLAPPDDALVDSTSYYGEENVKIVKIEKSGDPLGATVRNDGDSVIISRIVKGGAAERSGLFHEGDEILEVNGIEMRGKSINEVCDILSRMNGTLTFFIVPSSTPRPPPRREIVVHLRAHFDYEPDDDPYIPCRELGLSFRKGDVLHILSQEDSNWWQSHRDGEEDQILAGLIPSKSFQEQKETMKQTILGETQVKGKPKRGTLLCAKHHGKKKKKGPYSTNYEEYDPSDIPTYEEVTLYYPRANQKRPIILIGPPNIGRHELRQRLMQDSDRFAAAIPHTSRSKKDGELDGQDYHFISRAQFEADITARKFVEHGEFEKAYYGTSLEAIRTVVQIGKICVLNLHPQSLKILRCSDLKPYVVFIAPPALERLKQMRISRREAFTEEELIDIIEKAREMEDKYGHLFDLVLVNNDTERTYHELLQRINYLEREPQWVPSCWLK